MAGLPLYQIVETEKTIFEKGFIFSRRCGEGIRGLAIAFLVGYIDNLIIAQNTTYSNYQFVERL